MKVVIASTFFVLENNIIRKVYKSHNKIYVMEINEPYDGTRYENISEETFLELTQNFLDSFPF